MSSYYNKNSTMKSGQRNYKAETKAKSKPAQKKSKKSKPKAHQQDTVGAWKRILKDMAPKSLTQRKRKVDKQVKKKGG